MNLNKAFILGNVTRDPEVRALPSGQQVASFGIATNRFYTDQAGQKKQDAEFHNIVTFGKLADIAARYVTKGTLILVEGRIKTSSWQNASGAKQYKTEVIAESLQLGPRPAGTGAPQQNRPYQAPEQNQGKSEEIPIIEENYTPPAATNAQEIPPSFDTGSEEIDVKDIPF
ncbi:single-stranded DNA-binding protein [Candidatus Parcubacteria bacterium]|nr:single-stranded DNA-binding protein [Candidatus Parcubacteria bacterium]